MIKKRTSQLKPIRKRSHKFKPRKHSIKPNQRVLHKPKPGTPNINNKNPMNANILNMKKICIYTCIYGDYDTLKTHAKQNINCDYICLTDNPNLKSETWKIHLFLPSKLQAIRDAFPEYNGAIHANMVNTIICRSDLRLIPVLAEYDICVYIDGNMQITNPNLISNLLLQAKSTDLVVINKHRSRANAYQEAAFSSRLEKYQNTNLEGQISKYRKEGFPTQFPLFSNGFTVYLNPHSPLMDDFYRTYTEETINYCINNLFAFHIQGQVSLPYVLWKTSLPCCVIHRSVLGHGISLKSHRFRIKNHK